MGKAVTVIIVSYNTKDLLERCLTSLKQDAATIAEIIVVDNASADGSAEMVRQQFPHVKLQKNSENVGFARANNLALQSASSEYCLLLNSDTEVPPKTIKTMLQEMENQPNIGILGCQLRNPDWTIQPSVGKFPTLANLIVNRVPVLNRMLQSYFINQRAFYRAPHHIDWIAGACMLLRRSMLDRIGVFDETYFMYGEDVDLCYRAHQSGFSVQYTPQIFVTHHDLGRSVRNRANKYVRLRQGLLRFFKKFRTPAQHRRLIRLLRLETNFRRCFQINRDQRNRYTQFLTTLQ